MPKTQLQQQLRTDAPAEGAKNFDALKLFNEHENCGAAKKTTAKRKQDAKDEEGGERGGKAANWTEVQPQNKRMNEKKKQENKKKGWIKT